MKLSKVNVTCMVLSCRPTKSGKGFMIQCLQTDNPFMVFSKAPIAPTAPGTKELTVDVNCYVDKNTGEFKEFCSISE